MAIFTTIVLDGVGIGAQPDAALFGDEGSDTLGHVCATARPHLPNLARLGLGAIKNLDGVARSPKPLADYGRMREVSAGKDSTTGHWELAGVPLSDPFPTYPHGFPAKLVTAFKEVTGVGGVLGNEVACGTDIIRRLGDEHVSTGFPIVYTSADSVFQIATHTDIVSLDKLYAMCSAAREKALIGVHAVGRVIARPFVGGPGEYRRISEGRKDFSLAPPKKPIQSILQEAGVTTIAIGKISDLFAGVGFDVVRKTRSNREGVEETVSALLEAESGARDVFIWTNLVDFDQEYGHRNDVGGFARSLEQFDRDLPRLEAALPSRSVLVLTADHGNDPTFPGTDHCREYVPLLVLHDGGGSDVGLRRTFADHAAAVAEFFQVDYTGAGESFLPGAIPTKSTSEGRRT